MTRFHPIRWWKAGQPVAATLLRMSIDGKPVDVPAGISALNAADSVGIYIPALCAHPDLPQPRAEEASAACGLCLIEVVRPAGMAGLHPACSPRIRMSA